MENISKFQNREGEISRVLKSRKRIDQNKAQEGGQKFLQYFIKHSDTRALI